MFRPSSHAAFRLLFTEGQLLIRDVLRRPPLPRVQGVSSDSKNRNESTLKTTFLPSSFPLSSISFLLFHLMKHRGQKSQFLVISCGLSNSRLPCCRDFGPSPHYLPCLLQALGISTGRDGEQRPPSSSPTLTFTPSLPRPSRKDPLISPLHGLAQSCLWPLHAVTPPPSGQKHRQRLLYCPLIFSLQVKPPGPHPQISSPCSEPACHDNSTEHQSRTSHSLKCSLLHVFFSSDPHSHPVTQVSSCPCFK